jgi:hypothetical protein
VIAWRAKHFVQDEIDLLAPRKKALPGPVRK